MKKVIQRAFMALAALVSSTWAAPREVTITVTPELARIGHYGIITQLTGSATVAANSGYLDARIKGVGTAGKTHVGDKLTYILDGKVNWKVGQREVAVLKTVERNGKTPSYLKPSKIAQRRIASVKFEEAPRVETPVAKAPEPVQAPAQAAPAPEPKPSVTVPEAPQVNPPVVPQTKVTAEAPTVITEVPDPTPVPAPVAHDAAIAAEMNKDPLSSANAQATAKPAEEPPLPLSDETERKQEQARRAAWLQAEQERIATEKAAAEAKAKAQAEADAEAKRKAAAHDNKTSYEWIWRVIIAILLALIGRMFYLWKFKSPLDRGKPLTKKLKKDPDLEWLRTRIATNQTAVNSGKAEAEAIRKDLALWKEEHTSAKGPRIGTLTGMISEAERKVDGIENRIKMLETSLRVDRARLPVEEQSPEEEAKAPESFPSEEDPSQSIEAQEALVTKLDEEMSIAQRRLSDLEKQNRDAVRSEREKSTEYDTVLTNHQRLLSEGDKTKGVSTSATAVGKAKAAADQAKQQADQCLKNLTAFKETLPQKEAELAKEKQKLLTLQEERKSSEEANTPAELVA